MIRKISKRKKAMKEIESLLENEKLILLIHYSCESFYNIKDGHTPRITSIAVRFFESRTTKSFSIHKVAEKKKVTTLNIEAEYDKLEKEMLQEFFQFVENHKNYHWIHWNMRDINFGFEAIRHRFEVLQKKWKSEYEVQDSNKFDLPSKLIDIYSPRYIDHPRLEKLCEFNCIGIKDFLKGEEEAKAFENKDYIALHRSTLRKIDVMSVIFEKLISGDLKQKANWKDIYGISLQGLHHLITDDVRFFMLWNMLILFVGAIISHYMSKILN
ncbi:MAG: hypothetical protein ACRCZ9_09225 [Fusobacteriaceae bacterium]